MLGRNILRTGVCVVLVGIHSVNADPVRSHGVSHDGPHRHGGHVRARGQGWPIFLGFGTNGIYAPFPPILFVSPAMFFPPVAWNIGQPMIVVGPRLAPPPPELVGQEPVAENPPAEARRSDPTRSKQLITIGDRLFRAGNLKRAEERYQQALRVAPDRADPYVRLAQIAIARCNYVDAADRLRRAETAQPGWIITAADIQSIYAEPAAFAETVARLESHLQVHPDDRDAWLVLGAPVVLERADSQGRRRLSPPRRPQAQV